MICRFNTKIANKIHERAAAQTQEDHMKVLVACEESQAVTIEFRKLGHEAYSCDIEPCSGGHPEWHLKCDALELLKMRWDIIIAHPPCTYLTNAGAVRMRVKGEIVPERYKKAMEAKMFFMKFIEADCPRIAVENPTPMKLVGLPPLQPTDILDEHEPYVNGGCKDAHGNYRRFQGRKERDPKIRSKTFPGIARAMAEQWGGICNG